MPERRRPLTAGVQRLATAALGVPLAVWALFGLPPVGFFLLTAVFIEIAAVEYIRIARRWTPRAPMWALPALVPAAGAALAFGLPFAPPAALAAEMTLGPMLGAAVLAVGLGTLVLLSRVPVAEALPALGALAFGTPYLALPLASAYHLVRLDPWWFLLLLAIVWLGDTAAYYAGSAFGRHKMAPVVSPNKSWEGAAAGLLAALVATAVWSLLKLERVDLPLLAVGLLTGAAGQVGDLLESMLKRGAGIKDSGALLPGHGGILDRLDALLLAAPVFLLGVWLLGIELS